jgi:hypothetical protein
MKFPYDLREDARQSAMRVISVLENASGRHIFKDLLDADEPTEFIAVIMTLHGTKALKMKKVDRWRGWWSFSVEEVVHEYDRNRDVMSEGDPVWERLKALCLKGTEWLAYRIRTFDKDHHMSDDHETYLSGVNSFRSILADVDRLSMSARKALLGTPNAELFGIKD